MSIFIAKIKNKIPKMSMQTMNLHLGHRLFFYFLIGIVAGTFVLNFVFGNISFKIGIYNEYFSNSVYKYNMGFDKTDFFIFCCPRALFFTLFIHPNLLKNPKKSSFLGNNIKNAKKLLTTQHLCGIV